MRNSSSTPREFYSEHEAARLVGISVERLRALLDENVFNDGGARPAKLTLRSSDLALLRFWHRSTPNSKVVRMPRRG